MALLTKDGIPIPRSQFEIKLDLINIPTEDRARAKREVGDMVINEILRHLESGKSPVEGESFPKLTKEYAAKEKKGRTTPNLQLEGDLLDALKYVSSTEGIRLGIFSDSEQAKADGHNKLSGAKNSSPKRRFIPGEGQRFNAGIMGKASSILEGFRTKRSDEVPDEFDELFEEFDQNVLNVPGANQASGFNIGSDISTGLSISDETLLEMIEREALGNG